MLIIHVKSRISTAVASEYKINAQVVSAQVYTAELAKHNILVKAKNFLVFQGDVEHIASQNSKDLSRLVEQISGSLELAADYENAKKAVERATENATESFVKRRGFAGEIKVFKEQMNEAERYWQKSENGTRTTLTTRLARSECVKSTLDCSQYHGRRRRRSWRELSLALETLGR